MGCEKAACVYTAKTDGTAATWKCESKDGSTDATKKLCTDTKPSDTVKCVTDDNGGPACCMLAVATPAVAAVPAMCKDKAAPEDKSGAAAATVGFAAAAAALLM